MTRERHWMESGKKSLSARGEKAGKDSGLFVQFLDLFLDVFPHVAVEGEVQFTERTSKDSSFKQLFK